MKPIKLGIPQVRQEAVLFDGGLNENVSSLDLKPGELIECINYQLTEGAEGGYTSISGYERYDGQTPPSSIPADSQDHAAQDAARAAIGEVPGTGDVAGIHLYAGELYAFREGSMYKESPAGWVLVSAGFSLTGPYDFVNHNFSEIDNDKRMWFVDGTDKVWSYDGAAITSTTSPDFSSLRNIEAFIDRIWASDERGGIFYSSIWATVTTSFPSWSVLDGAGRKDFGFKITDLTKGVGDSMLVWGESNISVIHGSEDIQELIIDEFSDRSGALSRTPHRMLGTLYFIDDRGLTSLEAVDAFGDFAASGISQRVKRTLLANLHMVVGSISAREFNQYRTYLSNGFVFYFSFLNKKLSGATTVKYPNDVRLIIEGKDTQGATVRFFTSNTGQVYKMDSGTSFDGVVINTLMRSSFYHYKSPRNWKRFQRATWEISGRDPIGFTLETNFDYGTSDSPRAIGLDLYILGVGGNKWGEGIWGEMTYGGSDVTNRTCQYLEGIGTNMSIRLETEEAYKSTHTVQNMIVDFELLGTQY